jgi:hypothetical protein
MVGGDSREAQLQHWTTLNAAAAAAEMRTAASEGEAAAVTTAN